MIYTLRRPDGSEIASTPVTRYDPAGISDWLQEHVEDDTKLPGERLQFCEGSDDDEPLDHYRDRVTDRVVATVSVRYPS